MATREEKLAAYYDETDTSSQIEDAEWDDEIDENPMVTTSLRLPKNLLDVVRGEAANQGVTASALMRKYIERSIASGDRSVVARSPDLTLVIEILNRVEHKVDSAKLSNDAYIKQVKQKVSPPTRVQRTAVARALSTARPRKVADSVKKRAAVSSTAKAKGRQAAVYKNPQSGVFGKAKD